MKSGCLRANCSLRSIDKTVPDQVIDALMHCGRRHATVALNKLCDEKTSPLLLSGGWDGQVRQILKYFHFKLINSKSNIKNNKNNQSYSKKSIKSKYSGKELI